MTLTSGFFSFPGGFPLISKVFFVSEIFLEAGLVRDFSGSVVLVPLETFVFTAGLLSPSAAFDLDFVASGPDDALLVLEPEGESPILVRSVALVLLLTVNSVDLAAASNVPERSAVALRLGNVTDIVGVSLSSSLPRSGVDVQEAVKDLPALPNLDEEVEERASEEEEADDDDDEEVLELTPESVEEEDEALPSSLVREEGELHEDKLGVDMVTSSFRKDGSLSLDFPPCSL